MDIATGVKPTSLIRCILGHNRIKKRVEINGLIPFIAIVVTLGGLPVLVVFDAGSSLTDSNVPNYEITTDQTKVSNSSARATITITISTATNK